MYWIRVNNSCFLTSPSLCSPPQANITAIGTTRWNGRTRLTSPTLKASWNSVTMRSSFHTTASTLFIARLRSGSVAASVWMIIITMLNQGPWSIWATQWSAGPSLMGIMTLNGPTRQSCTPYAPSARGWRAATPMSRASGSMPYTWGLCSAWGKGTGWRRSRRGICLTWQMSRGRRSSGYSPCNDRWDPDEDHGSYVGHGLTGALAFKLQLTVVGEGRAGRDDRRDVYDLQCHVLLPSPENTWIFV